MFRAEAPSSDADFVRATFSHKGRRKEASRKFLKEWPVSTSSHTHDHDTEESLELLPKFDSAGLVTCVTTDAGNGDVLMVAHMNDEALQKTIATGEAWYYSRSRKALWRKGESSGNVQRVVEMRMDCDQDAIWIRVEQAGGAACHTGRRSCFYRAITTGQDGAAKVSFVDADKVFDPAKVYR
ncbi:MAG: phosphoribosyl-AMP cyclohydrolase [Tardiphaga sp.]|nr:phosphoribosyl-AMP cyclohydrolase [Tardiphaga sp.]